MQVPFFNSFFECEILKPQSKSFFLEKNKKKRYNGHFGFAACQEFLILNKNSSPPSFLFLTVMFPLCKAMAFLTIESPNPEPPESRVRPSLIR